MYINCVTKTPIAWGEKAKLFFICPNKMDYLQGFIVENDFSVIGLPVDVIYDEKMNFKKSETDSNYSFTIEKIEKMNKGLDYKASNSFPKIQNEIQKGKIYIQRYNEKVFVNVMAIKETVYNQIIKEMSLNMGFKGDFNSYKEINKKELLELKKMKEQNDKNVLELEKNCNKDREREIVQQITKFSVKLSDFSQDFIKYLNLSGVSLIDDIINHFDQMIEALFVLKVLEENGYFITPASIHSEGNNKRDFLRKLLDIQKEKEIFEDPLLFKESLK